MKEKKTINIDRLWSIENIKNKTDATDEMKHRSLKESGLFCQANLML